MFKFLIVDDDRINLFYLKSLIKNLGYETEIAKDGSEALEKIRHGRFDIVLLDIEMPNMNGIEAAKIIIADNPADTRPKIIIMSASIMYQEELNNLDIDGFLPKPLSKENLQEILTTLKF